MQLLRSRMASLLLITTLLLPGGFASGQYEIWVVDLGLGLSGEPHPSLATAVAVQTCVGLLNRDPSMAGAAYTLLDDTDPEWLADTDKICITGFNYTRGPCRAGGGLAAHERPSRLAPPCCRNAWLRRKQMGPASSLGIFASTPRARRSS